MYFVERALGNKSTENKTHIKLLKSLAIIAFGISTINLPENPNEICEKN